MSQLSLEQRFLESAKLLAKTERYINRRPIHMRGLLPGETCLDFLSRQIRSQDRDYWRQALHRGELSQNSHILNSCSLLQSGHVVIHTFTEAAEPPICTTIEILFENENLLVIDKPSPLPVHPCGRYHFHTFTEIAKHAWPELTLHLVHRLDAETSGVLVLAKNTQTARYLTEQFTNRLVQKEYLALVEGVVDWDYIRCELPIFSNRHPQGQSALTELNCLERRDTTSLILAKPITGRTNQIRIHLKELGYPVFHLHAHKLSINFEHESITFRSDRVCM